MRAATHGRRQVHRRVIANGPFSMNRVGIAWDNTRGSFLRLAGQREVLVALVIFILMFALVTTVKMNRLDGLEGDTATSLQATDNIAHRGVATSQVAANSLAFITESGLGHMTADQIAKAPLTAPPAAKEANIMAWHTYYILYPVAVLVWLFPVKLVLFALWTLSFFGLVALAYLGLRQRNVPVIAASLFCLLIVSHPAWSESLLDGQFYVDRFFVFTGFLLMYLASRENVSRVWLVVAGVLCLLVNERGALTAGGFLLLYVLLYWNRPGIDRVFKLVFSFVLLAYSAIAIKLVLTNGFYSSFMPTSIAQITANFQQPVFAHNAELLIFVNLPLILLALFEWRAAVIGIVLLSPNVLGTIGGAEKIGWVTHYHSYYFPALVWAAMLGYAAAYRKAAGFTRVRPVFAVAALCAVPVVFALYLSMLDPYTAPGPNLSSATINNQFFFKLNRLAGNYLGAGSVGASQQAAGERLRKAVPPGSVVTAPEGAMTPLYEHRTIRFFPMGLDTADYAVLAFTPTPQGITYSGDVSYLGPDEAKKVDAVIIQRMKKDRYDFRHQVLIPEISLAVVKRLK